MLLSVLSMTVFLHLQAGKLDSVTENEKQQHMLGMYDHYTSELF